MANWKDQISKGITTINVKTNNFMEESKYKTQIASLEKDIKDLKFNLGELYYSSKINDQDMSAQFDNLVEQIKAKYVLIDEQNALIAELANKEKQILSSGTSDVIYCAKCGAQNSKAYKFCAKCGNQL